MTRRQITTTSGRIENVTDNTRAQEQSAGTWSARAVKVTILDGSRGERVASLNARLRGNSYRSEASSK